MIEGNRVRLRAFERGDVDANHAFVNDRETLRGMLSGIPFFLPKMHERYTFGADVLSLVLAVFAPGRRILLPLCFGFASYAAYTAGLPGEKILDLKWAAMFQMVGVALTAAELWRALNTDRQNAALAEVKA